jgi:hypothetical protein
VELDNARKKAVCKQIPMRALVREERSKTGRAYEGFICEEGAKRIEQYLVKRMNSGGKPTQQFAVIDDDFRVSGDIEAEYRLHKKLSDSQLEQMRLAYRRASEMMLHAVQLHQDNAEIERREFRAVALRSIGFSNDEIKKIDLDRATTGQFQELVKMKLEADPQAIPREQMIVTPEEAENYVNSGISATNFDTGSGAESAGGRS